ncbi:MAG: hypothetical protein GX859_12035 [Corynebacterium humireducens]|mgnify:CR=1 FL=1|jgi:hypothetical protein|uniref:Uncharacterized protein n=1 Tax=Corynebacterium humireducens TaxID=1223514 RepID=A0A7X6PPY9_9CORY|nr:hypothetical protein [Corynebacterium humireducens]
MTRVSTNLVVMPAGPALVRELAPRDAAGQRMVAAVRSLVDSTGDRPVHLVGSRSPRWETGVEGSFRAWGAPQVQVGAGHHLPELVQRYVLGERASRVTDVRAELGEPDPGALTLVALDGSAGLTERAPLALLPQAAAADAWCRDLLAGREVGELPDGGGILEPELWRELAALRPRRAELVDADMEHGVGRYVAAWQI